MVDPKASDPAKEHPRPSTLGARVGKDLGPRVASGVVMAVAAAAFTWAGGWPFAGMILAIGVVLAWEWSRVVRGPDFDVAMIAHMVAAGTAVILSAIGAIGLSILALLIGAILVILLTVGHHPALSSLGVWYAGLPAIALLWFRQDPVYGLAAVAFLIVIVVVTDTAAYFSGRLIGGPRVWPRVSPNKTWAGLIGALIGSALAGAGIATLLPHTSGAKLAALAALLALMAQAGDFAESALKRKFGAKDASNIIPGHGGIMDRVDGLVAAVIVAAMIAAFANIQAPAQGLLTW